MFTEEMIAKEISYYSLSLSLFLDFRAKGNSEHRERRKIHEKSSARHVPQRTLHSSFFPG